MIRKSQVEKMLKAQREFDTTRPTDDAAVNRAVAVLSAARRNATEEEQREYRRRCGPGGRAPKELGE